jgi:hypothetical protein
MCRIVRALGYRSLLTNPREKRAGSVDVDVVLVLDIDLNAVVVAVVSLDDGPTAE